MPSLLYVTLTPFYPDLAGGAELSTIHLLKSLKRRGWDIEVVCSLSPNNILLVNACKLELKRSGKNWLMLTDEDQGFSCHRLFYIGKFEDGPMKWFEEKLREFKPDAVIGYPNPLCPLLGRSAELGYSGVFMAHNLAIMDMDITMPENIGIIANSPYTANVLSEKYPGIAVETVLEMIEPDLYKVIEKENGHITFINPIAEKGVKTALETARLMPKEQFLFVKGGWYDRDKSNPVSAHEPAFGLPNVKVEGFKNDMRRIYSVTDILLVPSIFIETFGRVIIEANINGIPVVASKNGGIPFTLGRGGFLIEPADNVDGYVDALRKLRSDKKLYASISNAARENSLRPEFDPEFQVDEFIKHVKMFQRG